MDEKKLIEGLNRDLADELATICCYIQQASVALGTAGHEIREFLKREVPDEMHHAMFLADKIVALGGTPVAKPAAFREQQDLKAILEYDLELERQAINHYTERIQQAEALGQIGLRVQLESLLADETDHAEEIGRLLGK